MTWRLCLLGVVSLASLVAPTVSGTGLSRAAAGSPGAIVFVSDRDSPGGLYLVNGDGTGLRRLAWSGGSPASNSTSGFEQPQWSPTGGLIAAIRAHEGVLAVGKTGDLTSFRRVSGPNDFVTSFSWSPDGKRLAYADIGKKTIDVVGTDGGGRMELASSGDRPAWSPDGRQIAFARSPLMNQQPDAVQVVSADGGTQRLLIPGARSPVWSQDGSRIMFARDQDLYVANSDGSGELRLTHTPGGYLSGIRSAEWSPDGSEIAFSARDEGTFLVRTDGSGRPVRLDRGDEGASWSPDGSRLAVLRGRDIWIVAADGSSRRRITEGARYGYDNSDQGQGLPEWNPASRPANRLGGVAVSPAIPTDSRPIDRHILRTTRKVSALAADGGQAALALYGGSNCLELWQPTQRAVTRFWADGCSSLLELALSGSRLTWLIFDIANHAGYLGNLLVTTASKADPAPIGVAQCADGFPDCVRAGDLHGAGGLTVYATWSQSDGCSYVSCFRDARRKGVLLRLDGNLPKRILSKPAGLTVLAVGDGRVAIRLADGSVEIVDRTGRTVVRLRAGNNVQAAALAGSQLVLMTSDRLLVYNARSWQIADSWPIDGFGKRLAGLGGDTTAYLGGRNIQLVRLSDGRHAHLRVPGQGPVHAALTNAGLFYSYATATGLYRGRVVFVSLHDLTKKF